MSNLNIHATLGVAPATIHRPHEVLVITRGASAELLFNFINHSYLIDINEPFKYIDQITFLFKQNNKIIHFDMINSKGQMNPEFAYDEDRMCVSLLLSPAVTSTLELASELNPMSFEIAIRANTEFVTKQGKDTIIIEPQHPIIVVDSLYNQANLVTAFK